MQPTGNVPPEADRRNKALDFKKKTEGAWRDRDFAGYIHYIVDTLELKQVLEEALKREDAIEAYRMYAIDSFVGPDGGGVTVRMDMVPRWTPVVKIGLKAAFGIFAFLIPDKLVDRIALDLGRDHKLGTYILDTGMADVPLDVAIRLPDGSNRTLGHVVTDGTGRATIDVAPLTGVPAGRYPILVEMGEEKIPQSWKPDLPMQSFEDARLDWRPATAPAEPVLVVNVSNTLYDLETPKGLSSAIRKGKYLPVDECVGGKLDALRQAGVRLVFISQFPEGVTPFIRRQLVDSKFDATDRHSPVLLAPPSKKATYKTDALKGLQAHYGMNNVRLYLADDEKRDGAAAAGAKVAFRRFERKTGWCSDLDQRLTQQLLP